MYVCVVYVCMSPAPVIFSFFLSLQGPGYEPLTRELLPPRVSREDCREHKVRACARLVRERERERERERGLINRPANRSPSANFFRLARCVLGQRLWKEKRERRRWYCLLLVEMENLKRERLLTERGWENKCKKSK